MAENNIKQNEEFHYGTTVHPDGSVHILIPGNPYTKKNSQRIAYRYSGTKRVPFIMPSQEYKRFSADCAFFLKHLQIIDPVNVEAHFYMQTRRKVDLTNLNEALHDILVDNGVLEDDESMIVVSTDGSRVYYDKDNPRTEVIITPATATMEKGKRAIKRREMPAL